MATKFFSGRTGFTGKRQKINKYVLRKAFQDELNEQTQKRAKAVSNTVYLLFNGALRPIISKTLSDDLKMDTSFIREYQYEQMAARFLNPQTREEAFRELKEEQERLRQTADVQPVATVSLEEARKNRLNLFE